MGDGARVRLADAIEGLRRELMAARGDGKDHTLQFEAGPIELTLEAVITQGGNAGVSWWLIEAGASVERAVTQSVKLTLSPKWVTPDGMESPGPTLLEGADTRGAV